MSADYGSATIAGALSKGNVKAVQDMLGTNAILRANSAQMQNGHIGAAQAQVVTPAARAALIAAQDTPALKSDNSGIKWDVATGTWVASP